MLKPAEDPIILDHKVNIPYTWSTGQYVGKFYEEIRDNEKIFVNICPECDLALVPPRIVCGRCKVKMGEWIEMGPNGTVLLYTIVEQSFWDALIDGMKEVPFTAAYIELDGPRSVAFSHVLKETDPDKISLGMRVRPVFKPHEERVGHLTDILYFESIA